MLTEDYNVKILDKATWSQLLEWYGLLDPKQVIVRSTVERDGRPMVRACLCCF